MARRGVGQRLRRWAVLLGLAFVALTALPVLALRWIDPWTSAFMLRARYEALRADDDRHRMRYEWVDLEDISAHAAVAVIAAEDQHFARHGGFDFRSIREAARHNGRSRRLRGASTISQQVAKNLFLWPERSWLRKGLEAYFTVLIELAWPKRRILEVYLNIAEFGRGTYGVQAAAVRWFGKPAVRLDRRESARLAAVLPSPRRLRVERPSAYVLRRERWILAQMHGLGGSAYLRAIDAGNGKRPRESRT